jgi:uncharacterized repeat protein (TIGR01451 family)
MAAVMVAVAAVVCLPAVTWATGPGSQCEVAPAGTSPAAHAVDCEPEPAADESQPVPGAEGQSVSGLSLSASAEPSVVAAGDPVTFIVAVHNAGPASDAGVTVMGAIPAGAVVSGTVVEFDPSDGSIDLGAMAVGESRTVAVTVYMPQLHGEVVTRPHLAGQPAGTSDLAHQDTVVVAVKPDAEMLARADESAAQSLDSAPDVPDVPDAPAAAGPPGSSAGAAGGDGPGVRSGDAGEESGERPPGLSGDERRGTPGGPGVAHRKARSGHPLRVTNGQPQVAFSKGHDQIGQTPTARPLVPPSDATTDTTLVAATGAVVGRVVATPLALLGTALLAVGGVLLGVGGAGTVRIRRR